MLVLLPYLLAYAVGQGAPESIVSLVPLFAFLLVVASDRLGRPAPLSRAAGALVILLGFGAVALWIIVFGTLELWTSSGAAASLALAAVMVVALAGSALRRSRSTSAEPVA